MDAMTIRVVGMRDKERIVYFGEALKNILINYIEQHPAEKGCDLLFQHNGQGYSLDYLRKKQIIKAEMKVEDLQEIMGTDNIDRFMKYVKYVKSNNRKKQKRTVK